LATLRLALIIVRAKLAGLIQACYPGSIDKASSRTAYVVGAARQCGRSDTLAHPVRALGITTTFPRRARSSWSIATQPRVPCVRNQGDHALNHIATVCVDNALSVCGLRADTCFVATIQAAAVGRGEATPAHGLNTGTELALTAAAVGVATAFRAKFRATCCRPPLSETQH